MMEARSSSETPVLTRATRRNIPEDVILHPTSLYSNRLVEAYVRGNYISTSLDTSLLPAVTDKIETGTFGKRCFLCGTSVAASILEATSSVQQEKKFKSVQGLKS
jgi:hypothetical protein